MSTDDESFHPLGQEWEGELEEMLDETEYDSDLGMEMAQDAMRVTKGELSEAEFHEMYHDDVMEEFGVDDRPTEAAYEQAQEEQKGTATRMLEAFEGDGEESRRDAMKKMGVGAAAVGLGAWGTVDDGPEADLAAANDGDGHSNEGTQLGMVIDLERCDGCLSCVTACQEENQTDQGVNWMYVLDYREPGQGAEPDERGGSRQRLVRPCQHCTDAPCEKVCPTTARHTREKDGLVLTDYDVCIGCRYCQVACPYGVNYFQWGEPEVSAEELEEDHIFDERGRWVGSRSPKGVMEKCTFCATRQDGTKGEEFVGRVACEDACPPEAIQFGDMNDSESDPQQYLDDPALARVQAQSPPEAELQEAIAVLTGETEPAEDEDDDGLTEREARSLVQAEGGTGDSTFRLLEDIGTEPNIVYIGNEPGPNAQQVDGPVDYEDVGHTDNRKDIVDQGTVGIDPFN